MFLKNPLALFIACLVLAGCSVSAPKLKANDRVVFFGDSITYQGNQPGGYVTLVRDAVAKAHPNENIAIIGAGIGGNKVPNLLARLDSDVIAKKPSIVVIYIGINDVWHWRRNDGTSKDVYENGLNNLVDRVQASGARVILCTPSVIGEKKNGGNHFDAMLDEHSGITRKVAEAKKVACIDLRAKFKAYIDQHNPDDVSKGILTRDEVHLTPSGNQFVANEMLTAIGN